MSVQPKPVARRYFLLYSGKKIVGVDRPEETEAKYIKTLLRGGWVEVSRDRWLTEREKMWTRA